MIYLSGFHAIEERIKSGLPSRCLLIAKPGPRAREIIKLAQEHKIPINRTGTAELDRLSADHRGILLETEDEKQEGGQITKLEDFINELGEQKEVLVVILDEITDPHNYGAILRSCDQFGVNMVITRKRRTAKYAEVIANTSAGASAWVSAIETANLSRAIEILKDNGFWIYGADMEGEYAFTKDLRGRTAIILGGEGSGITRILKESCDALIAIPKKGRLDSLNVSVAAGVLLYEVIRQRAKKN